VPRVPVTDDAIQRIKDMIVSGELKPGQRLPREPDLAEHLGLSRSSLREAVKALSVIRILDVRQGDGTYVTSLAPEILLDALSFIADLHQDDTVLQILEVRRIIEPAATAMACQRMSDDGVKQLHELLDEVGEDAELDELLRNDLEFHRRIAASAGNDYLARLLESLSSQTARARIWRGVTEGKATSRTLAEHRAIADALASRDVEAARAWATVHVAGVEQWLRRVT
jgi:DNA-binding FadR family transcriptional regulator